jgi:hypothetical protein
MPRAKASTVAVDVAALKRDILKHNIETAISVTNRVCDFRLREVDSLVDNYITLIPPEIRTQKLSDVLI